MTIVPQEFWQGVEQFNQRQFYACHDTLEALWTEATEPERTFYQGILQIAVALYHLSNSNWRGTVILLGEGMGRLRRYPSTYAGIDVDSLLIQSAALLTELQQAGSQERIEESRIVADVVVDEMQRLPTIQLGVEEA